MSRPIAYNASGPLSGSIRGGNVNYTVDSGNRDYTSFASKKWVPSADGAAPIVFVTDTYTQGFQGNPSLAVPLFYSCNGTSSAAIIYTANRIPGSPGNYSDANVALNDLISARGYFILESNDPFGGIDADSLVFDVDASKMSSYPQTGTSWRDLSGNSNIFDLLNGPSFNPNGYLSLDGVDDYLSSTNPQSVSSISGSDPFTFSALFKLPRYANQNLTDPINYSSLLMKGAYNPSFGITLAYDLPSGGVFTRAKTYSGVRNLSLPSTASGYGHPTQFSNTAFALNRWYQVDFTSEFSGTTYTLKTYVNGNLDVTSTSTLSTYPVAFQNNSNLTVASSPLGGTGVVAPINIAKAAIYKKTLSQAEINQNYYQAPIVTDGLVFATDAGNLVSYESGSTTTYSMTGSLTGSLLNGVGYLPSYGGAWNFDSVDDRIFINTNLSISSSFTIEYAVLIKELPTAGEYNYVFQNGAGYQNNGVYAEFGSGYYSICTVNSSSTANSVVLSNPQANVVYYATATYENRTLKGYINGNLVSTSNLNFDPVNGSNNTLNIGAYGPFVIPFWRFYNKSLSSSEVQQNYQAEQYRFKGPSNIVTNGLTLWLDASNLDSYPGTGTTWYDLSGNSNNGTLKSAAQWSNLGWMNYRGNGFDDESTAATVELNTTSSQGNTVELWIYGATLDGNGNMPFVWGNSGYDLWWYNNLFGINNGDSLQYGITGANSILLNNWVHVVVYFPFDWAGSYTNAKMWINGVAQTMTINGGSLTNRTLNASETVYIGGGYTGGSDTFNWNGRISQTRIYTRELTTSEVQQNYNATKAKFGL